MKERITRSKSEAATKLRYIVEEKVDLDLPNDSSMDDDIFVHNCFCPCSRQDSGSTRRF